MKNFLIDLFEFHHHYNQKIVDFLMENKEVMGDQSCNLFSHMINAHQIWNGRILNTKTVGVHQKRELSENKELDTINFKNSLSILNQFKLATLIKYQNTNGAEFEKQLQTILFHITNHHSHHRGQIISLIRQKGMVPMATDYIHYKHI